MAADDTATTSSHMKELLNARLAEEAKKKAAAPAAVPAPTAAEKSATTTTPATSPVLTAPGAPAPAVETKNEPPTVLPKMEVKNGRITQLDMQIQKQEHDIALEKKNTKATEADKALNDLKIAKPLAIFGGESSQFREHVASERVSLMEAEKDILEAMKTAKTRAEKAELQKQLDEIKAMRRDLEKAMR
jgi:uncharacterized membrane protein